MRIDFNGNVPWFVLVLLFLIVSGFSVMVYRKHKLPKPWNIWLPGLRMLTVLLLLLMLKQPVLVHIRETEDKGRVAILIDNSGSMSVHDDYSPAKQVELAANLGLFTASSRNSDFSTEAESVRRAGKHLRRINRRLYSLIQAINRKNKLETDKQYQEVIDNFDSAANNLGAMVQRLDDSVASYDYLSASAPREALTDIGSRARGLTFKRWDGIEGGDLKDLLNSERFKREPQDVRLVPNFDAPQNSGSNIGVMLSGYIHPPISGNYVFYVSSDDQGALYLSTNKSSENKQKICWTQMWTKRQDYKAFPEQESKPIHLEAHKVYYVEALMKELLGSDHVTVGWKRPDGTFESPIPGEYLRPQGAGVADYIGPDFDRLYPQVRQLTKQSAVEIQTLSKVFPKTIRLDDNRTVEHAIHEHRRAVLAAAVTLDELQREMEKLQEAADLRLAMAKIKEVDHALIRFRKMSRADIAREILTGKSLNLLETLKQTSEPKLFVLGDKARFITPSELPVLKNTLSRTDLSGNIRNLFTYFEDQFLAGVIILTDGNNNTTGDLRELRKIARERDVPLIGVGIGSTRPPRDIAVEAVLVPDSSFRNDQTLVTAIIKRDGYTGESIAVSIVSNGRTLVRQIVPPGLESRISIELPFSESRSGSLEYAVVAQFFDGEQVRHNNKRSFKINILRDPIRVLLVDAFPRWESRYLTMMMQRDTRFTVTPVFSGLDESDRLDPLPLNESLYSYQVLILGDVDPARITGDQFEVIRSFVEDHGGSIFFVAGAHYMPQAYLNTPLRDLLPLSETAPDPKTKAATPNKFRPILADDSGFDPMTRIAATPEMSNRLWKGLPQLSWVKGNITEARSADMLLKTTKKELPIIIRAHNGMGRVVYIGSDSFWRWRERVQWRYYHRFWGQLLLWAALDRSKTSNNFVKLMTPRPEFNPGEAIEVTAKILDPAGHVLNTAHATLYVFDLTSSNVVKIVELQYLDKSEGRYLAVLKGLPVGKYRATPHVRELAGLDASSELRFEVSELPGTEFTDLNLDRSALKSFSTNFLSFEDAARIPELIPELKIPRKFRREWSIWDAHPALLLIVLLLGLEWYLRKRLQLP